MKPSAETEEGRLALVYSAANQVLPQFEQVRCLPFCLRLSPVASSETPPVRTAPVALPPLTPALTLVERSLVVPRLPQCGQRSCACRRLYSARDSSRFSPTLLTMRPNTPGGFFAVFLVILVTFPFMSRTGFLPRSASSARRVLSS